MLITYPLLFLLVDFVSQDFKAKLSDFGLAKDGPEDDETHVSTRVMGTQGYAAPEYIMIVIGFAFFWLYLCYFHTQAKV